MLQNALTTEVGLLSLFRHERRAGSIADTSFDCWQSCDVRSHALAALKKASASDQRISTKRVTPFSCFDKC